MPPKKSSMMGGAKVHPLVFVLVICFALSSWVDLFGVWVQLPILVHLLPEGWTLPSYLIVLIQCGNIAPITYGLINRCCPGNIKRREIIMIYIIMSTGFTTLILLVFTWDKTAWIAGAERSICLMVLILLLSSVDTSSNVVYLPYMSNLQEQYIPAYIAGEQMGGFVTGLLGMIQGSGGQAICTNETEWSFNETTGLNYSETTVHVTHQKPRISVSNFFLCLVFMMLLSIISFTILNYASFVKSERSSASDKKGQYLRKDSQCDEMLTIGEKEKIEIENLADTRLTWKLRIMYFFIWFGCFSVYGIMGSILPYASLPYGALPYTLSVRILTFISPLCTLGCYIYLLRSVKGLCISMAIVAITIGYLIFLATQSPNLPFMGSIVGPLLSVGSASVGPALLAYLRACISTYARKMGGHEALTRVGAATIVGTITGGTLGFILVSVLKVFGDLPACDAQ